MARIYERTYLLKQQRDPARLKRKAFEQFAAALQSNQMIAFTGSYATTHLGYPDWTDATKQFIETFDIKDPNLKKALVERVGSRSKVFDFPDLMDVAELAAELDRYALPKQFRECREQYSENFNLPLTTSELNSLPSIESTLIHELGIRRIVTLNYDIELEWAAFFTRAERRSSARRQRKLVWNEAARNLRLHQSGRLERLVPGFGKVVSEVMDGTNVSQLTSFALLGDSERCRILHLHGRCDYASSMMLSRRDYRDRYWAAGFSKLPFEYGLRTIMSGNPILFVGIGMSEFEVTKALEQMLSDNPNRRAVPMFIVWNSSSKRAEDDATRLLFYRKFGIHVLYDTEIAEICDRQKEYDAELKAALRKPKSHIAKKADFEKATKNAKRMALPLSYLADWCPDAFAERMDENDFRNGQRKYEGRAKGIPPRINIWRASDNSPTLPKQIVPHNSTKVSDSARLFSDLRGLKPVVALIGDPGSGRGAWAETITETLAKQSAGRGIRPVLVNAAFAYDTDSIFAILSGAFDGVTAQKAKQSRFSSAMEMINRIRLPAFVPKAQETSELCLVINGIERFVAQNGSALSTEMDVLIRMIPGLENAYRDQDQTVVRIRLFLLGSPRLGRYLNTIASGHYDTLEISRSPGTHFSSLVFPAGKTSVMSARKFVIESSSFFTHLATESGVPPASTDLTNPTSRRKKFFDGLDRWIDESGRFSQSAIVYDLLRTMSFVGQPIERSVLPHLLNAVRNEPVFSDLVKRTETTVTELIDCGLLLKIDPFPERQSRVGLHKALAAELRQKSGVPLTETQLAASFNLGLFAAQPMDNILPDQRWHNELSKLVDFLIGQFYDEDSVDPLIEAAAQDLIDNCGAELRARHLHRFSATILAMVAAQRQSDSLRAALSIMRSFFSTSALLMHGNRGLDAMLSNGPLTEHAEQLKNIIRVVEHQSFVRNKILSRSGKRTKILKDTLGAPAFYPDDLVWLRNELGVVLTAQGRLNEARESLEKALKLNSELLEFGEHRQNWRRISINLMQVLIEQGELEASEDLQRDVETSLEREALAIDELIKLRRTEARTPGDGVLELHDGSLKSYLFETYLRGPSADHTARVDPYFPTNLILGTGLVLGYRGLCLHLRGSLESGLSHYDDALGLFQQIGEPRAYALFQRHRASLLAQLSRKEMAAEALRLCNATATPAKQTDIDHSGRIAQAASGLFKSHRQDRYPTNSSLPQLKETLRYAIDSDMYRLQLEAMQVMAFLHWNNEDTDSALQYTFDAMAIASRFGFELRKVSLRILLARILASRNERDDARDLLHEASRLASGLQYARSVEAAEDALVMLDVDSIDAVGVKNR